jgi:[protein-PII] uridylyltransferase
MPSLKEVHTAHSDRIFQLHRNGADGLTVAAHLSAAADEILRVAWAHVSSPLQDHCAVMALGGYGRYELSPHSDFDLMMLFADENTKDLCTAQIQEFLQALWDSGFDLGHSVRSVDDCIALRNRDVESWASILESRFICGSETVCVRLENSIVAAIRDDAHEDFLTAVLRGIRDRHEKYGNAVKLLEPNMKNSAGGLRDLHSLLWLFRSGDAGYLSRHPFRSTESACRSMLRQLELNDLVTPEESSNVLHALNFLLRVRHETHYYAKVNHDALDFAIQRHIAEGLGYGNDPQLVYVEKFMREYYLHARNIHRLNRRLARIHQKQLTPAVSEHPVDDLFVVRGSALSFREHPFDFTSPDLVLRAFRWCGLYGVEPGQSLQSRFIKAAQTSSLFQEEGGGKAAAEFRTILGMERHVASTLMLMNDFDILGLFIPEWLRLVAFFQHSQYHFYTTDAHSLIALERAEHLADADSLLGQVYRSLPRKDLLFLAILLHDIEKPQGAEDHEIRGAATARRILSRLEVENDVLVPFLIAHHLTMEQIAFRRNINDPKTIAEFSQLFDCAEQLDYLFVLTYSDLSAVNKSVWTSWKEMLLQELYSRAHAVLTRRLPYADAVSYQQAEHLRLVEQIVAAAGPEVSREDIAEHLASLRNEAYVALFPQRDIADHVRTIRSLDRIALLVDHDDAYSTITVVTRDAAFLLSNLCGVLSANDANIFDAHIFTRTDGVVIDQFRVTNIQTKVRLTEEQISRITSDMESVLTGAVNIETLFEKHRRRWKRRRQPILLPTIKRAVEFEESADFTIIDVYAPDTIGFLYRVTRAISELGLGIYFAKIATRVDGIVDSFYVLESASSPVNSEVRKDEIKRHILQSID